MTFRAVRRLPIVAPVVSALSILAVAAGPAQTLAWAEASDPAKNPAFATSRAVCRGLMAVTPPPGDAPNPEQAAALADCSSEALYYGIGRPADPESARLCAAIEKRSADPQVTDFGFTGDRTLIVIYANGLGAVRDLDIATALACRAGGAPAEIDARVRHLARLKAAGWTGTTFSLCDDIATGLMQGICADHDQLVARSDRARALAALSSGWSPADRIAFAPLKRAEAALADARGQGEVDQSGSGRGAPVVAAEDKVESAFAALLAEAEAGRVAPASAAETRAAEEARDAVERKLMARVPTLVKDTTITAAGLAAAERAWLRYRDAWMAFARVRYPALAPEALLTRLTRERAAELADVPTTGR